MFNTELIFDYSKLKTQTINPNLEQKRLLKRLQIMRQLFVFLNKKNKLQQVKLYQLLRLTKCSYEQLQFLFGGSSKEVSLKNYIYYHSFIFHLNEKINESFEKENSLDEKLKEILLWAFLKIEEHLDFSLFISQPKMIVRFQKRKRKRKENNSDFQLFLKHFSNGIVDEIYKSFLKTKAFEKATKEKTEQFYNNLKLYQAFLFGIAFCDNKGTIKTILNLFDNGKTIKGYR